MGTTTETGRDTGVWLHGVVAEAGPATLAGIAGMGGARLRAVAVPGLAAVVSDAPLAEYGEAALRRNLEDLAWLEQAARTHHAVIDGLCRAGLVVVPARLATVYHDDERVARVLVERHAELAGALSRLAGREEWGVKAYAVPGPAYAATQPIGAGGSAGAAYLRRRKAQLAAREEGQRAAAEAAATVHTALAAYAVAACRHAPQDRRLSGAATTMVLNGAYLIDREDLSGFEALVAALADRNPAVRLELTGPWPPYSFVAEDTSDTEATNDAEITMDPADAARTPGPHREAA